MEGFPGVIAIETSVAGFTVSVVVPEMLPEVAVIVEDPAATDVARPEALMVATPVLDEAHCTVVVKSWVVLSEKMPVAVNC